MREAGKSALVSLAEPARLMVLAAGARMADAGALAERDDVFGLTWLDVETFLRGEWDGAGANALVASRKAQRAAWLAEDVEDIYVLDTEGQPTELPASSDMPASVAEPASSDALVGVGAAAGRATGIARVVRQPEEGSRLGDGEVLVAPSTDPAWTPLFLRASAVVTEVGGYLSHGAIVAREYGLPAVVNVHRLLERVPDGATIVVDGDAGRVEIVHGP
jgi:pyruvate,water dikinase